MLVYTAPPTKMPMVEKFYAALKNAEVTDFLTLPDEATFLGDPSLPSSLFIRKAYKDLHNLIHTNEKHSKDSALVLGNPGIGKSYFSYYELYRLLQQLKDDETIVYESVALEVFMVFDAQKVISAGNPSNVNKHDLKSPAYYLFDAGTKGPRRPFILKSKCIVFSSPARENYHDYWKLRDPACFYMPIWSLDELKLVSQSDSVDSQYAIFGGIPRYVFSSQPQDYVSDMYIDLALYGNIERLIHFIVQESTSQNSHPILHLVSEPKTDYQISVVKFASPFVVKKYYKTLEDTVNNSPLRFLVAFIGNPFASAVRGQIFELWAHKHLSRGGTFKIKQLHDDSAGGESELTLPEMECLTFSGWMT